MMNTKKDILTQFDPLIDNAVSQSGSTGRPDPTQTLTQPLRVALPPVGTTLPVDGSSFTQPFVAPYAVPANSFAVPGAALVRPPTASLPAQYYPAAYVYPNQVPVNYGAQSALTFPLTVPTGISPAAVPVQPAGTRAQLSPSSSVKQPTLAATTPATTNLSPNRAVLPAAHSSGNLQSGISAKSTGATKWYDDLDSITSKTAAASVNSNNLGRVNSTNRTEQSSVAPIQKYASSSNVAAQASTTDNTASKMNEARSGLSMMSTTRVKTETPKKSPGIMPRDSLFEDGGSNREERITIKMEERLREYLVQRELTVLCASWNVNGQLPTEDLSVWLTPWLQERLTAEQLRALLDSPGRQSASEKDKEKLARAALCDIVVVAFQELDLSVGNALQVFDSGREPLWHNAMLAAVNKPPPGNADVVKSSQCEFERIKSMRLVGILLVVYVRKSLSAQVRDVSAENVPTGFMSMMGNKGAVAVRLRIGRTTVCFVGSHLCAHSEHYESRNQEFRDINARLRLTAPPEEKTQLPQQLTINDHHAVFWLGDLNYRLNDLTTEQAKDLIGQRAIRRLLENDQLMLARRGGKAFTDYQEGDIDFAPTYKFDPGTDNWDSSEKCRVPAFCDRILWRVQPGIQADSVRLLKYTSHPTLKLSDHKPISALFALRIEEIDRERENRVYQQVLKDIDKEENEMHPSAEVDIHDIVFDNVHYLQRTVRTVILTNKSDRVPFSFLFTPPPRPDADEFTPNPVCQPWLSIKPVSGRVEPRASCTLNFEIFINAHLARKMIGCKYELQDLLILHLKGGCDIFLTVTGRFVPSCFGLGLHALVHLPTRVREIPVNELLEFASKLHPDDRAGDSAGRTSVAASYFEPYAALTNQLIDVSDGSSAVRADAVQLVNPAGASFISSSDAAQLRTSFRFGELAQEATGISPSTTGTQLANIFSQVESDEPRVVALRRVGLDNLLDKCTYQPGSLRSVGCLQREACDAPFIIPKELWLILDLLNGCALREPGLFSMPGLHDHHRAIAEYLDTGIVSPLSVSVHSVVEVLLHFLQALPDAVVPTTKYAQALHVADDADQSRALISGLPRVNRFVFFYVTSFVNKCLEPANADFNMLDRSTAAQPLGDVLLRAPDSAREDRLDPSVKRARRQKRATFVAHFLQGS